MTKKIKLKVHRYIPREDHPHYDVFDVPFVFLISIAFLHKFFLKIGGL